MKHLILLALLAVLGGPAWADSMSSSGTRILEDPVSNGDFKFRVNVGGTKTDAITITGSTGAVTIGAAASTQQHQVNGGLTVTKAVDLGAQFVTTGIANTAQVATQSGSGTTSGRLAYFTSQSLETSPQRWDAGMFGTKDWVVHDSTNSRTPLLIAATDAAVTMTGTSTTATGLLLKSGSTSSHFPLVIQDSSANQRLSVRADGPLVVGTTALTGGSVQVAESARPEIDLQTPTSNLAMVMKISGGTTNEGINGSAQNDLIIRTPGSATGSNILMSTDNGTTSSLTIARNGGAVTLGNGLKLATSGGTAATLAYYDEVTWSSLSGSANGTCAVTYSGSKVRVGKVVTITITFTLAGACSPSSDLVQIGSNGTVDVPKGTVDIAAMIGAVGTTNYYLLRVNSLGNVFMYKRTSALAAANWAAAETFSGAVSYTTN